MKKTQSSFKDYTSKSFKDLSQIFDVLEGMSKTNFKILKFIFLFCEAKNEPIYPSRDYIADKIGCCAKTVTRFNSNFTCFVSIEERKKYNKRNLTNLYTFPKKIFLILQVLAKYALFRADVCHKDSVKRIRAMYEKTGQNWEKFVSNLEKHNPNKINSLKKNVQLDYEKSPTILSSYSPLTKSTIRQSEASAEIFSFGKVIEKVLKFSLDDLDFYSRDNRVRSQDNFLASRALHYLEKHYQKIPTRNPYKIDRTPRDSRGRIIKTGKEGLF